MPLEIIRNDITKVKADAIVNAANAALKQGGGVCGAIFLAAGAEKMQKACDLIGRCETGEAVITKAYKLPAKFIIHTVGPVWSGGGNHEHELLYSCYKSSLELAKENGCKTVAFPLIASGTYGYPKDEALQVAISAIGDFLFKNDMTVFLVIFDKSAFKLSEKLYSSIQSFIDDCYADTHYQSQQVDGESRLVDVSIPSPATMQPVEHITEEAPAQAAPVTQKRSLNDVMARLEETFSQRLLRLIDERRQSDTDVYKRANIDRRIFSKIRSNKDYKPSKNTALAFAIALELSLDDTLDLLMKAGYALSRSNKQDMIVEYFITEGNYNIFEINEALFAFDQNLLGC